MASNSQAVNTAQERAFRGKRGFVYDLKITEQQARSLIGRGLELCSSSFRGTGRAPVALAGGCFVSPALPHNARLACLLSHVATQDWPLALTLFTHAETSDNSFTS